MRATIFFIAAAAVAADRSPQARAWWSHVEHLADDKLEGRKAGTEGHKKAADYVQKEFAKAGLQPAGKSGYFQPVEFVQREYSEDGSSLELIRDAKPERIKLGDQAYVGMKGQSGKVIEAEAVFVGHALRIPEHNIDDFKGIELEGKVAVYLSGAPKHLPGPIAAHAQSAEQRWNNLRAAGAIGTASFQDPAASDIPWERSTLRRFEPNLTLADPALAGSEGQQVQIVINPAKADVFLEGTGQTVAKLLAMHRAGKSLPRFPLKAKLRVKSTFATKPAVSDNVLGILPGSDPKLKNEYIVLSAHLDHLGVGAPIDGDRVYNGAMDNASGIASLIEIAKSLKGKQLKRSVLFAAVTGEEGGLMGSKFFAAHPTVAAGSLVANVNLDMYLPLFALKAITVYGLDESDLGPEFAQTAKKFGVGAERDPEPQRNGFIRSDQCSFIRRGIPALTFKFHAMPNTPEGKITAEWRKKRYHAPSDDLQQPVDVEAAVKFNAILAAFTEGLANRTNRPSWNGKSFFRRYAS